MKKRTRNLLGVLTAGAVALSGAVCSLRSKNSDDKWKRCEFYVESPSYPRFLQENVFDKIYVGLDDTMKHPESDRVKCLDLRNPGEEMWNNYCIFRLTDKNEGEQGLMVILTEELISPDKYRFSSLNIEGFEKHSEKLRQIVENSPWIFEGALNKGYIVKNIRDKEGRIVERCYELSNGKKIVAKDSNGDGTLDRYKEE